MRDVIGQAVCSSCGAPIEWARFQSGARVPLDIEPGDKPNLIVSDKGTAHIVPSGYGDRTSHFVTCPNADEHRRSR